MVDTAQAGGNPAQTSNRSQLDKLIFDQNLDEVHLLIDFISGRADRSLTTLVIPGPANASAAMSSRDVIKAIADMRYPPDGSDAVNAENAAVLLLAKDRLSALAAPARGLTIAYTAMFIDAEVKTWVVRAWDWFAGSRLGNWLAGGSGGAASPDSNPDTRVDLSARAFPILQSHARRFRRWRDSLALFSVVWLVLTAMAYWDAGLGRAALERLDQNWKTYTDELKDDATLVTCGSRPAMALPRPETEPQPVGGAAAAESPGASGSTASATTSSAAGAAAGPAATAGDGQIAAPQAAREIACRRHEYHNWIAKTAGIEVRQIFSCENMGWGAKSIHVWCWRWLLTANHPEEPKEPVAQAKQGADQQAAPPTREPRADIRANARSWQIFTSVQTVFTAYILPMMFALLGTLIGSFRAILNRVRDSELAPRDFVRMLLGIPTGLVAGIAVGLFLSPSSVPVQGAGSISGQLTLTTSGLGFLAGYASQSFFTYLDTIVGAIFPNTAAATDRPARRAAENQA